MRAALEKHGDLDVYIGEVGVGVDIADKATVVHVFPGDYLIIGRNDENDPALQTGETF